jgi:hypothetical protein
VKSNAQSVFRVVFGGEEHTLCLAINGRWPVLILGKFDKIADLILI